MDVKWVDGEAWYNTMPGVGDKDLHVAGTFWLSSVSTQIRFERGNPGINPDPEEVVLELITETPDACLEQIEEAREIGWKEDVGPDIKRVRIIGAVEVTLEVKDVQ